MGADDITNTNTTEGDFFVDFRYDASPLSSDLARIETLAADKNIQSGQSVRRSIVHYRLAIANVRYSIDTSTWLSFQTNQANKTMLRIWWRRITWGNSNQRLNFSSCSCPRSSKAQVTRVIFWPVVVQSVLSWFAKELSKKRVVWKSIDENGKSPIDPIKITPHWTIRISKLNWSGNSDNSSRSGWDIFPQLRVHSEHIFAREKCLPFNSSNCPLWALRISKRIGRLLVMHLPTHWHHPRSLFSWQKLFVSLSSISPSKVVYRRISGETISLSDRVNQKETFSNSFKSNIILQPCTSNLVSNWNR